MFGLPSPYLIGGIALVIAGLAGWGIWQTHELRVAREAQEIAEKQRDDARQDASRWQAASDVRDATIGQLKAALDEQSAIAEAGRAKERALNAAIRETAKRNIELQTENAQLERDLDAEAANVPGDVREIGPIVARRAPALFN